MANLSPSDAKFIEKLNQIIQNKMTGSRFGVSDLAREMGMSRSNLYLKVRRITGKQVNTLISEARLKEARELLKEGVYTVSEVSWRVGFGSVTYFNKCFRDFYGFPPGEAAKRSLLDNTPETGEIREVRTRIRKKQRGIMAGVLSLISLAVIMFVFIFIKTFTGDRNNIEKSIAVLPFINDSHDTTNVFFINGVMENILENLSRISDIKVIPRRSVEQYRNNKTKTLSRIAKELGVKFIVEGSGQKADDSVQLFVTLVEAGAGKYLFRENYTRKWEEIFSLQRDIATSVAKSIKAKITSDEFELMGIKPTENMAAHNLYLDGMDRARIAQSTKDTDLEFQSALLFKRAIQLDSTYSDPYIGLAWHVIHTSQKYDSALYLADQALHFDSINPKGLYIKGYIFLYHSGELKVKEAENVFKLAIKYNPNSGVGYSGLGQLAWIKADYPLFVEYFTRALQRENDPDNKRKILTSMSDHLAGLGLNNEGMQFAEKLIEFDDDSLCYYKCKLGTEMSLGDYNSAYQTGLKLKNLDKNFDPMTLIKICLFARDYRESLKLCGEYLARQEKQGTESKPNFMFGYVYLNNGQKEKSDYHIDGEIRNAMKTIENDHPNPKSWNYIVLAGAYAAKGDKSNAVENVKKAMECEDFAQKAPWLLAYREAPWNDTFQDEPAFREIFKRAEELWLPERNKIRSSLKEYWSRE